MDCVSPGQALAINKILVAGKVLNPRSQSHNLPNEIATAKLKAGQKIYFRQDKFLALFYRQKQLQNKSVIMLLTFCGAFDGLHCKKEGKVVPTTVDLFYQNMGVSDSSDQVMHSYAFE